MQVTAINSAGESSPATASIYLGNIPAVPIYPALVSVTPQTSLTISWQAPLDTGCLPILNYVVQKNGADLPAVISASASTLNDDISTGGTIGT